ncbi:MAG: YifB family Mg chelatase-like AAA ATPase [Microbacteriaceae bacterium]
MSMGRTLSVAVLGLDGQVVEVEANLTSQTPDITLIGLPDTSLREAEQRIKSAVLNSGGELPRRRLVVNLIPAGLPKQGTTFDLAIAVSAMVTSGVIPAESILDTVHLGELGLDGRLRPMLGALPAVRAAALQGVRRVIVPHANKAEAGLVADIEVLSFVSLNEVLRFHGAQITELQQVPVEQSLPQALHSDAAEELDLHDIVGNADAVQAALVAAAGGHNLLLIGPPGSGKSMIAQRFVDLLPDLSDEHALEASCLLSLWGGQRVTTLQRRPPLVAPHHTATPVAMIGGGSTQIRPGAAVMASHGVLFLDEATEFSRLSLDSLRQPLETGNVQIHRARQSIQYPAKFQLLMASNPCPCGKYSANSAECSCPTAQRQRYLARLSGPLLDRVDLRVHTFKVTQAQLNLHQENPGISSAEAQERVQNARLRAAQRLAATAWKLNAQVNGSWLRGVARLSPKTTRTLDLALDQGRITMRGYDRILRVAWTLADLAERAQPAEHDIGRALYLRQAV